MTFLLKYDIVTLQLLLRYYLCHKKISNWDTVFFFLRKVWIKPKDQNDASIVTKTNFKHL
jgi:hypothetical protein